MLSSRRKFLLGGVSSLAIMTAAPADCRLFHGSVGQQAAPSAVWAPLKVGAGGFLRDFDVHTDGTLVCKTDTYGAYVWNPTAASPGNAGGTGVWQQLCAPGRIQSGDVAYSPNTIQTFNANLGAFAIRIAPTNSSIFYMVWLGNLYVTSNKGVTWTNLSAFPTQSQPDSSPNDNYAQFGPKMAIDPNNSNVVWVGTASSLIFTQDGGTTFTTVSTSQIPTPTQIGGTGNNVGYAICHDPTSSVV